jgi:hypothetical protein
VGLVVVAGGSGVEVGTVTIEDSWGRSGPGECLGSDGVDGGAESGSANVDEVSEGGSGLRARSEEVGEGWECTV